MAFIGGQCEKGVNSRLFHLFLLSVVNHLVVEVVILYICTFAAGKEGKAFFQ